MSAMTDRKPGSEQGFQEILHWRNENGAPNRAERSWMYQQVTEHVEPTRRVEVRSWIANRRRTRRDLRQLCKRWGIELPDLT